MTDEQRARKFFHVDADTEADSIDALVAEFAAVRADERKAIRGSEVIPIVRHLAEVGRCADEIRRTRRWAYLVNRIDLVVDGCRLIWPDLFDEADRLEHGGGS